MAEGSLPFVYLDYNATAPLLGAAQTAYLEASANFGNSASPHGAGRKGRQFLEDARAVFAKELGVSPEEILFTSGATESNNLALKGALRLSDSKPSLRRYFLLSPAGHPSATFPLYHAPRKNVSLPALGPDGGLELEDVERRLAAAQSRKDGLVLLSLPLADGITGILETAEKCAAIYKLTQAYGALFHIDLTQAFGRMPLGGVAADLMSCAFHKIGGAKGCGLLYVNAQTTRIAAQIEGGGQERRLRGGTQNYPALWASAVALRWHRDRRDLWSGYVKDMRDALERSLESFGIVPIGAALPRLPNTSCLFIPGQDAHNLVIALDLQNIMTSAGSACHSGRKDPPLSLLYRGIRPQDAACCLRISLDPATSPRDMERLKDSLGRLLS